MPTAVYPGSLDPITFGHIDAIRDAASFGQLVIALGINPSKKYMFSLAEREALAKQAVKNLPNVSVTSFAGLLVHFMVRNNYNIVVRGLRNGMDLSDAMTQDAIGWQQTMAEGIKSFYVPARLGQTFTSSTALKAVLKEQGDATPMAPLSTIHATQARLMSQYFYGLTGTSGSGKSTISRRFAEIAKRRHIPIRHIDLDKIGHAILKDEADPLYQRTRGKIATVFGSDVMDRDGSINRKKLGEAVFGHPEQLQKLNDILHNPIFFRMNDMLRGQKGIFLVDTALLAEINKLPSVNNNVLVVEAPTNDVAARLRQRDGLTTEQIQRRISSQFSLASKISTIKQQISDVSYGGMDRIKNNDQLTDHAVEEAFDNMLARIDIFGELRIVGFFKELGHNNATEAYGTLRQLYGSDDRFYHTLAHIVDGLDKIPAFASHLEDPKAFTLAWLFHDAVYDTHAKDNEEASAALMGKLCASWGMDQSLVARAQTLIMATKDHKAKTADEKWITDLDISILGCPANLYQEYEHQVRREYGWASAQEWAGGRKGFLEHLQAPYFQTDFFADHFAAKAEKNIRTALNKITPKNKDFG